MNNRGKMNESISQPRYGPESISELPQESSDMIHSSRAGRDEGHTFHTNMASDLNTLTSDLTSHSQFFSESFSPSDYLHHILQSFALSRSEEGQSREAFPQSISGGLQNNAQIAHSLTTSALQKLNAALSYVFEEIRNELKVNWSAIIERIGQIDELRQCHKKLKEEFDAIQALSLSGHFSEDLFSKLEKNVEETKRLHSVVVLLRLIARMHQWMKDIEEGNLMKVDKVLCSIKVARIIRMYESKHDLHGIHIVQSIVSKARSWSDQLKREASVMLSEGLKSNQEEQISSALDILFEIQCLRSEVTNILTQAINNTKAILQSSFETSKYQQAMKSLRRGSQSAQEDRVVVAEYFKSFQASLSQIHTLYVEIWHLSNMLRKKQTISQISFESVILGETASTSVLENYWSSITKIVTQDIISAVSLNPFLQYAFTEEYPLALEEFTEFAQKFTPYTEFLSQKTSTMSPGEWITHTMRNMQLQYIEQYKQRFDQAVTSAFFKLKQPRSFHDESFNEMRIADIERITKEISQELSKSKKNNELLDILSKAMTEVITQFTSKCKELTKFDEETFYVNPFKLPNIFLRFNAHLFNCLCTFYFNLSTLIPDFSQVHQAYDRFSNSLEEMKSYTQSMIAPLYKSLQQRIEEILFTLHLENYTSHTTESAYVQQLQKFLPFMCKEYIHIHRDNLRLISNASKELIERLFQYLVMQLSLLNPIAEEGRMKLANDMTQIELSLGLNLHAIEGQGKYHRQLKTFRKVLFMETDAIQAAKSQLLIEIDPVVVAHHLFSRIPPSPSGSLFRVHNNVEEYTKFLQQHQSNDILAHVKNVAESKLSEIQDVDEEWSNSARNILALVLEFCI